MNSVLMSFFDQPASPMNFVAIDGVNGQKRCRHPLMLMGGCDLECGGSIEGRWQRVAMILMAIHDVQT
jgi:hypothetical protein